MSTRFSRTDSAEIWTHLNALDDDVQANAAAIVTTGEDVATNEAAVAALDTRVSHLEQFPRARGSVSASVAIGANYTQVGGYTEEYDTANALNPATGAYVVPVSGLYAITAGVNFGTAATRRFIQVDVGTAAAGSNTSLARVEGPATGYSSLTLSTETLLTAGQTIALVAYTAAAGNIRGDFTPAFFTIRRVA